MKKRGDKVKKSNAIIGLKFESDISHTPENFQTVLILP